MNMSCALGSFRPQSHGWVSPSGLQVGRLSMGVSVVPLYCDALETLTRVVLKSMPGPGAIPLTLTERSKHDCDEHRFTDKRHMYGFSPSWSFHMNASPLETSSARSFCVKTTKIIKPGSGSE